MTLLDWQKRITKRVFRGEFIREGELSDLLSEMWEEAQSQAYLVEVLASTRGTALTATVDKEDAQ